MKSKLLIIAASIIPFILISGCFNDGFLLEDTEYKDLETFDFIDSGDGHLEETESEIVFTLDLEEKEYFSQMNCWVRWRDEEPVNRMRQYYNDGDQFSVCISYGENISRTGTGTNGPESEGLAYCNFPSEIVDSQTVSRPVIITVEVCLINAGDHYAYQTNDEASKVEDTGNDYSWSLEYTITIDRKQ